MGLSWVLDQITRDKKALTTPLGLCTVAALCPANWDIAIIDENIEPIDSEVEADIVGVCGMAVQFLRQKEILSHFRRKGRYVVAGGSYASLCPEEYADLADTVISGEAEYIWPQFCTDFEKGTPKKLYQQAGEVDLTHSPVPCYDLVKTSLYCTVGLQFSRGCPFLCEFCDIIVTFGRKPRTKSLDQVERELDSLRALGISHVFFVDDNFIGHLPHCKMLLAFLAEYQKKHDYRFTFGTEASINMAADRRLLESFREANFQWVFIGIETPNQEALIETKKIQNTREDLLKSIGTIYSFGLDIYAGFIVGFDADDQTIFDRQFRFIVESGIIVSTVGLLTAIPKTPLFRRLQKANRLRSTTQFHRIRNNFAATNLIPLKMTYDEMIDGFLNLQARLSEEKTIYQRISNKFRSLLNSSTTSNLPPGKIFLYSWRFLIYGLLPGGYKRWYYFLGSLFLAFRHSVGFPIVIMNWIYALSYRQFCLEEINRNGIDPIPFSWNSTLSKPTKSGCLPPESLIIR